MAEEKTILTDRGVAKLSLSSSGQYIVRDAELAGFFIMVGKQKKTIMVQADLRTNEPVVGHCASRLALQAR